MSGRWGGSDPGAIEEAITVSGLRPRENALIKLPIYICRNCKHAFASAEAREEHMGTLLECRGESDGREDSSSSHCSALSLLYPQALTPIIPCYINRSPCDPAGAAARHVRAGLSKLAIA